MQLPPHRIDWAGLSAFEPRLDEVAAHAGQLAAAYNDPHNAPLLGHTERLTEADVIAHYEELLAEGRAFLLTVDGALAGDGDLRGITDSRGRAAEFAFMISAPSTQGRGLGTRFATMLHAFAFGPLALDRVYASIVPANTASRRVFEKLGYSLDDSPAARAFADDPGDVVMAIDRAAFQRNHAAALAEITLSVR